MGMPCHLPWGFLIALCSSGFFNERRVRRVASTRIANSPATNASFSYTLPVCDRLAKVAIYTIIHGDIQGHYLEERRNFIGSFSTDAVSRSEPAPHAVQRNGNTACSRSSASLPTARLSRCFRASLSEGWTRHVDCPARSGRGYHRGRALLLFSDAFNAAENLANVLY